MTNVINTFKYSLTFSVFSGVFHLFLPAYAFKKELQLKECAFHFSKELIQLFLKQRNSWYDGFSAEILVYLIYGFELIIARNLFA